MDRDRAITEKSEDEGASCAVLFQRRRVQEGRHRVRPSRARGGRASRRLFNDQPSFIERSEQRASTTPVPVCSSEIVSALMETPRKEFPQLSPVSDIETETAQDDVEEGNARSYQRNSRKRCRECSPVENAKKPRIDVPTCSKSHEVLDDVSDLANNHVNVLPPGLKTSSTTQQDSVVTERGGTNNGSSHYMVKFYERIKRNFFGLPKSKKRCQTLDDFGICLKGAACEFEHSPQIDEGELERASREYEASKSSEGTVESIRSSESNVYRGLRQKEQAKGAVPFGARKGSTFGEKGHESEDD